MKRKFKMHIDGDNLIVSADFNTVFPAKARSLGGDFKRGIGWVFDPRNAALVKAACLDIFGTDGDTIDVVDVEITIPEDSTRVSKARKPIAVFGWILAEASGRDSGAKLGDNVTVLAGGFNSGGSRANWYTQCEDNTKVLLRDVSRRAVEAHDNPDILIKVIGAPDFDALEAEKAKLVARLCEINEVLNTRLETPEAC